MKMMASAVSRLKSLTRTLQLRTTNDNEHLPFDWVSRYEPSRILTKHQIQHTLWFEDVLVFYGSDTCVFDFHLLVPNPRRAAAVLKRFDYVESPVDSLFADDVRSCRGGLRLAKSTGMSTDGVVLISADVWDFNLEEAKYLKKGAVSLPIPPLKGFLESIMQKWLTIKEDVYECHLIWEMSLVCLIGYCYSASDANGATIRYQDYAAYLRPEFRELHYDLVCDYPHRSSISSFRKREYHAIRWQQIKRGDFTPRPYSTVNFPVSMAEYPHLTGLDTHTSLLRTNEQRKSAHRSASLRSIDENVVTTPAAGKQQSAE